MRDAVRGDGPAGRDQGLGRDLAAEDARYQRRPAGTAEDVLLDLLEVEQIEERRQCLVHGGRVGARIPYRPMDLAMIDFMISLVPP